MLNYVAPGETVTLTAPADLASGQIFQVGAILAVACNAAAEDEEVEAMRRGIFKLDVEGVNDGGNSAVIEGDQLYYTDGDTPALSKKVSGNFAGYALGAVNAGASAEIDVLLTGTPGPGTADILAGAVDTAELADGAVTGPKLAGSFLKVKVIAGGAAGDLAVAGAAVGDDLCFVGRFDVAADTGDAATGNKVVSLTDLTAEFTIGANKINNVDGTNTTGDSLMVIFLDLT